MAALSVRSPFEDGRDHAYIGRKIPQWRIGLANIPMEWMKRCASSCRRRDLALDTSTPFHTSVLRLVVVAPSSSLPNASFPSKEESTHLRHIEIFPSNYESAADELPYDDFAENLASVQPPYKQQTSIIYEYLPQHNPSNSMTALGIDFDDTSNFRQAAGKKAKKAQSQAQKSKWADDGDEGNKDGGEGDGNGGEGGGSNNGDGGAGSGGGGGDDWNDWDTGNKKKIGKKAKEEEKKKKQEEEDDEKKEEEDTAAANGTNALSWADDANGDLGDDWGGFTTTTKKDKKGKKGKVDNIPDNTNGTSNFDDINLNDDAPKLDLDFGSTEKKDSGFGFTGWGGGGGGNSNWGTSNTWSFGNGTATTDITDSFSKAATTDTGETGSSWSFGGNKKNKKNTTTTSGFDFGDFGTLDEEKEPEIKAEDTIGVADADLDSGFTATGKKAKKDKKKGIFGDTEPDLGTIGTAVAEHEPAVDDGWGGGWGGTSSKKKKGKKAEEEDPLPPPTASTVPVETPATDDWGCFGTKKNKKGGKKITEGEEPAIVTEPDPEPGADAAWGSNGKKDKKKGNKKETDKEGEPAITTVPDLEPDLDFGWGSTKKSKKKGPKTENEKIEEPDIMALPKPEPALDFGRGISKKDKKSKHDELLEEPAANTGPDPEVEAEAGWGSFGSKKKKPNKKDVGKIEEPVINAEVAPKVDERSSFGAKKDEKKQKKSIWDEPENDESKLVTEENPELDTTADTSWGVFGSKKDKGKKGKNGLQNETPPPLPAPDAVVEEKPDLMRTNSKKDKKGRKGLISEVKDDPLPATESKAATDAASSVAGDDDLMSAWGSTDKKKSDKKTKRNSLASSKGDTAPPPPPPVPAVPDVPDASSFDLWGSSSKKDKDKKSKKANTVDYEAEIDTFEDPSGVNSEDEFISSLVGLPLKEKKKKEKERELLLKQREKDKMEAEPKIIAFENPVQHDSEDDFLASLAGLTTKEKKKKEKERDLMKKEREKNIPDPEPDIIAFEDPVHNNSEDEFVASIAGLPAKEKRKKEKEREKKKQESEKEIKAFEDPVDVNSEDEFMASLVGLSLKDRKKKEKEREKLKLEREKAREEREAQERKEEEERAAKEKEEEEERAAKEKEKSTVKGKLGKKVKNSAAPEVSKNKDLLAGSVPDIAPIVEESTWGSWGTSKKEKKGVKKDMEVDAPPPAPTPPAQGLTPEPEEMEDRWASFAPAKTTKKKDAKMDAKVDGAKAGTKGSKDTVEDVVEEAKPAKDDTKKKPSTKEETPAKAVKSFWGGMGITSSKEKPSKGDEKVKKDAEAEAELDPDEIVEIRDGPAKKSSNVKIGSKLSKTTTKDSKSSDAKKSIADDDTPTGKGKDSKSTTKGLDKDDEPKDDAFSSSLWGSSFKKPSGKKGDEAKNKIGKEDSANGKGSVNKAAWNDPEPTELDDQPAAAQPAKSSKTAMSSAKSTKPSSVLQRVKELEKNKAAAAAEPIVPPPPADPEPVSTFDKKGASSKTKDSAPSKSKKKESSLETVDNKKGPKDSVPGSFPGELEGMDDDLGDLMDSSPIEKKETKDSKKSAKSAKESKIAAKARDTPESKRPPTPPPEPKEEKPAKRERPRVAKTGGASSWGMWGAPAPAKGKKEVKSKDDADDSPPKKEKAVAPGLNRSKSTRTAKEKDKETVKSDAKSSDSDKPKKPESRPPKSRGSSFGALFGGAPNRTKSVRRPSTATSGPKLGSRRPSMDVDLTGLPSPPVEDAPEVTGKAAKLMGVKGGKLDPKASIKGKQKVSAAPDPYAIDSDDMVMVNGLEDPIINAPISKKGKDKSLKSKPREVELEPTASLRKDLPDRTKSRKESKLDSAKPKRQSKAFNEDEDVVMVDSGPSDGPEMADGPDDMQFITKPKSLQRSATSSKRPESKIGGLFGAFRKNRRTSDSGDRPRSKDIVEDEVAPRKRTVTGGDDSAKRPRRDDRRRSERPISRAAEGFVYDTAGDGAEAEEADAHREERSTKRADKDRAAREAREEALKYEAERRSKRRAAEKDKLREQKDRIARKAEEAEAKQQQEKDARRAARRAKEDEQANRELEEDILKPRSKRRDTAEKEAERSSRPKSDRRRSHYDKPIASQAPDEDEARRQRHEDRRAKADRRKSAAPVEDYFDPRNGKRATETNDPYGGGGNDHTASWVESLAKESPEPPPLEPTIMEPAPDLRAHGGADDLAAEEDLRRSSHRKSKRSSRMYADPAPNDDHDERRRRRESRREGGGVRSGEGSAEEERVRSPRRQSTLAGVNLGAGAKMFDGKTGQGKRSSWFQKIGGRM